MATIAELLAALQESPRPTAVGGLAGSAPAYLLARRTASAHQPTLIIVHDLPAAVALARDIAFFADDNADAPILFAPRALPYQGLPTTPEVEVGRLRVLQALVRRSGKRAPLIIAPVAALLQRVPPTSVLQRLTQRLSIGSVVNYDALRAWFIEAGYEPSSLVEDAGTFAVRGAIIDCWPPSQDLPCRLEICPASTASVRGEAPAGSAGGGGRREPPIINGDLLGTIRRFDPSTQRSHGTLEEILLGPADEWCLTEGSRTRAIRTLKERADDADIPVPQRRPLLEALQRGLRPPLLEGLLSLIYEEPSTIFDYLPENAEVYGIEPDAIATAVTTYWDELHAAAGNAPVIAQIVPPEETAITWHDVRAAMQCALTEDSVGATIAAKTESTATLRERIRAARGDEDPLTPMAEYLRALQGQRQQVIIVCHTALAADRTVDLFRWHGLAMQLERVDSRRSLSPSAFVGDGDDRMFGAIHVVLGELSSGLHALEDGLVYVTEQEIFGKKIRKKAARTASPAAAFLSFQELGEGDYVVHERHGIGRYMGVEQMTLPGQPVGDFVHLEYLGHDKLYLPVYRLSVLQRYVGPSDTVPVLDRLGGQRWSKARHRALKTIRTMAQSLLKIYAERQLQRGLSFSGRDHHLEEFEATFPYDETPDQWEAIEATLKDMQSERPMDRLICGDVGYGKTEVAMRAAFRAAADGHQVAILCPTTLLAFQHAHTFAVRFAPSAMRVELLSRFRSDAEQREVVRQLANGEIDIIIGTHRLLGKDIKFLRLALMVIDEEQRFGVAHKERLRKMRATIDTLSLSATPIPRTLHMSLSGLRDISIIQTPPADRHAIRTYVVPFNDTLVTEAIGREVRRGGQVFFVHNRVQSIAAMGDHIRRLVPDARIVIAHGQMEEEVLEEAMRQFVAKEADILLCTSIIEAGLDIPSANTLIVNRADTFGLSQLYQIRGRVGRSSVQAMAYLLIPQHADPKSGEGITPKAHRRLKTLARFTELGSGFSIAMHDLEMRGAGNLLGAQQSGHIAEIGYELFTRLLEQTIRKLRGEAAQETIDPEITLPVAALIPASYLSDANLRLVWYKRLASCTDTAALEQTEAELADRFGPLPPEARNLLQVIALRIAAMALGIELMQFMHGIWRLRFATSTPIEPAALMQLVTSEPDVYRLKPDGTLIVQSETTDGSPAATPKEIFQSGRELMQRLVIA